MEDSKMEGARLDSAISNFTALLDLRSTLLRWGAILNEIDVITRGAFEEIPTPPRGNITTTRRLYKIKEALVQLQSRFTNLVDTALGLQSAYQAGLVARSGGTVTVGNVLNLNADLLYGCRLEMEDPEESAGQDPDD